jgi:Cof subfamily protein (haloacid dehalogenase superfamily)
MKDIKLIITDLDCTLLHTDKSISEYTRKVFKKCSDRGIITAIATARYHIGAEKFINIIKPDFEITTDGTMVYCDGKLVFGCGFNLETTNNIIGEIRSIDGAQELTVATDEGIFWNNHHISKSPILYRAIYNDYSKPLNSIAYKIVAELPNKESALNIANQFPESKMICYRGENRYGFISKNSGKVQAIRTLADYLKIEMCNIIAFGDDLNDKEMLEQCGHGIAVSNAVKEVLDVADYVTDSNDEDGVAKFIDKYILNDNFSCYGYKGSFYL